MGLEGRNESTENFIEKFKPIINNIVSKAHTNSIMSKDDIRQELYMKLVELMPILKQNDPIEIFSIAKACLNNKYKDLIGHYVRRPDTSIYAKVNYSADGSDSEDQDVESSLESLIHETDRVGSGGIEPFHSKPCSPQDIVEFTTLKEQILKWANRQKDELVKLYINEAINPSEPTLVAWGELVKKGRRYSNTDFIPPFTLCKILGITGTKRYRIIDKLGYFLAHINYNSPVLTGYYKDKYQCDPYIGKSKEELYQ